jgi:hypothetical protein
MGDTYDTCIINDKKFFWNKDVNKSMEKLIELFPKYDEKIRKYFQLIKQIPDSAKFGFLFKIFPKFLANTLLKLFGNNIIKYYIHKTVYEVLKDEFQFPEELIDILTYNIGNIGNIFI